MANVKLNWVLPTTRESGKPLAPEDVGHVTILLSADGGANFGEFGQFTRDVLETTVTDLEPGNWVFGGVVVDTAKKASKMTTANITIPDATAPGALISLTLSLV